MNDAPLVYIVAAERSGDLLGAGLVRALRERAGARLSIRGIGGEAMADEGIPSAMDIDGLSILGYFDGLKALGRIKAKVAEAVEDIITHKPAAVVLIDSWGFMLRVAQGVRARDPSIKLIKYVGPQVFATRPGRARTLSRTVDHLMTILSFDQPYYEPHGLPVTFVGNPTLDRLPQGDREAFRERHGLGRKSEAVLVLFGSRSSEIRRIYAPFSEAIRKLRQVGSSVRPIIVVAEPIRDELLPRLQADPHFRDAIVVGESEKIDAFAAADVALACSGTVVTELASVGVPTITAYRLGWFTWAVMRGLNIVKVKFISLINIAAGTMLVPEFVQTRCRSDLLANALAAMLDDPMRREALSRELRAESARLRGEGDASSRAAETVLEIVAPG